MSLRDKIIADLAAQEQHEGLTPNIVLCRKILNDITSLSEFQAVVNTLEHRYGTESYKVHHFYYVKDWLKSLLEEQRNEDATIALSVMPPPCDVYMSDRDETRIFTATTIAHKIRGKAVT